MKKILKLSEMKEFLTRKNQPQWVTHLYSCWTTCCLC